MQTSEHSYFLYYRDTDLLICRHKTYCRIRMIREWGASGFSLLIWHEKLGTNRVKLPRRYVSEICILDDKAKLTKRRTQTCNSVVKLFDLLLKTQIVWSKTFEKTHILSHETLFYSPKR